MDAVSDNPLDMNLVPSMKRKKGKKKEAAAGEQEQCMHACGGLWTLVCDSLLVWAPTRPLSLQGRQQPPAPHPNTTAQLTALTASLTHHTQH
jgi:hypothetical protein